ncbi:hypothetical protein MHK_002264 [Candidatus Magnetomorum sp. HK-1]|nr:hypothetical protein MHK_002264 [Candidatus Magnetomorum sp. HK-1]
MTTNHSLDAIIVEDSPPDRLRMRLLLNSVSVTHRFAWNAETNSVLDPDSIIKMLKHYLPSRLVIDLAWTVEDDRQITKLRFKDVDQIKELEKEYEDKQWISGIRLIDTLSDFNSEAFIVELDQIVIVSKYIPPVSYGLHEFLTEKLEKIFNVSFSFVTKWSEEHRFKDIML